MSVAGLERALGMLLLDAAFRERFFVNPSAAAWEAGLPLSPIEVDALSRVSRAAIARFRESLEPRLRGRRETEPAVPGEPAVRRHRDAGA
ncbi:MAG TPA: Os1348 family NHLP clan protein [Methylomirabilota bacterium]|jgi:hypothetical protein